MIKHKIITRRSKTELVLMANELGEDGWTGMSIVQDREEGWSMLLTKYLDK